MEYFVEQAYSHREAMEKVKARYGEHARIMHHKTVRMGGFLGLFAKEGVEVTGYISREPVKRRNPDLQKEKEKILAVAKPESRGDAKLDQVLKEVQLLKQQLSTAGDAGAADHPNLRAIEELLYHNDFSPRFVKDTLQRAKRELSVEDLEDIDSLQQHVLRWIGESVKIYPHQPKGRPEVFILVGPTGVGKTTTIAKLAAMFGIGRTGERDWNVRIMTIDNYRIAARKQIETYGEIMDIPVASAESTEDMERHLSIFHDVDLVFVDTIGKSPRDFAKLGEMNDLLQSCGTGASVHLAVSATTKTTDLEEILQQFEPFRYRSVIITKLDETTRIGNILSALYERGKPISYLTDGQRVPQDIEPATVPRLLINIEGFRVNRQYLERTFG
jgi:flagellar biosynthesis protein FlhF